MLELFLYLERTLFIRNFLRNKAYSLNVNFVGWQSNGSYAIFIYNYYYFFLPFLLSQLLFLLLSSLISFSKHSPFVDYMVNVSITSSSSPPPQDLFLPFDYPFYLNHIHMYKHTHASTDTHVGIYGHAHTHVHACTHTYP